MPDGRFLPPWTVEELDACFVVRDHDGQQLAYVYFEDESGRRSAAKLLERGRGKTDCYKYRETARAIEPPSDVGCAIRRGGSAAIAPMVFNG
jgi:hypothetical protein